MENGGQTLASVYYDAPYEANGHSFRNWWGSRGYLGYSNIRDGIIYSMNIVAVRTLMETVTPQMGAAFAESLGITSLTSQDITASLALGGLTQGVSNLELTAAYGAIANGGTYVRPVFFTRILDRNGRVLLENEPEERRGMQESTAFLLTDAMEDSLEPHQIFARAQMAPIQATSTRARLERMAAAGKSGTTTDNRDAWFVGFIPYYTAGIWTGFDDNNRGLSNTNYHKTIWKNIMERIHEELPTAQFQPPEDVVQVSVCRKSGKLAVPGLCDHDPRGSCVYTEYFARGTEPQEVCDVHVSAEICSETGLLAGEYCPDRVQGVFMVVPQGETAVTDDSLFTMPSPCTVHGPGTGTEGESPAAETGSPGPAAGSSGLPAGSSGRSAGPGGVQENEGREETVSPWPME